MNLVRPSCIVAVAFNAKIDICCLRNSERFTIIESFKCSELILMFLDEIREFVHQSSSLTAGHAAPRPMVESCACSFDSFVHIFNS